MVACAISEFGNRISVDVESYPQRGWNLGEMASATMSADEASDWSSVCNDQQRSFLLNWCAKEAYSKALGVGLLRDPRTYRLVPKGLTRSGPQAFEICEEKRTHASAWHTQLSVTDTGHVVSAVCDGAELEPPVLTGLGQQFTLGESKSGLRLSGRFAYRATHFATASESMIVKPPVADALSEPHHLAQHIAWPLPSTRTTGVGGKT